MDGEYHSRLRDGRGSTAPDDANEETGTETMGGIFDRVGSFVERTSSWSFADRYNITAGKERRQIHPSMIHCRPTAVFSYDWRRPLPELCTALHQFCEDTVSFWVGRGPAVDVRCLSGYCRVQPPSSFLRNVVSESASADRSAFARRFDDFRRDAQTSGEVLSRRGGGRSTIRDRDPILSGFAQR